MAASPSAATFTNCATCDKAQIDQPKPLRRCARCSTVAYCSRSCQTTDWPSHKPHCRRQNYLIKAHLCPNAIVSPPVTRSLSCPATATFAQLHQALQIAFGWTSTHAYDFKLRDPASASHDVQEDMDVTAHMRRLMQAEQMRRQGLEAEINGDTPRKNLLRIVEWIDPTAQESHVDAFLGHSTRRHPATPEKFAHRVRLWQVLDGEDFGQGGGLEYEYDFGDRWTHALVVAERRDATDHFECVDGSGYGVAEDVGGPDGWEKLKEAYRADRPDSEQKEIMKWFETEVTNRDAHGLRNGRESHWEKEAVNKSLIDAGL